MSSLQTLLSSRKYFTNLLTCKLDKILMEIDLKNSVFFRQLYVWEFQKGLTLPPTTKIEEVRAFQTPAYIGGPGPLGSFQSSKFRSFLSFQKFWKFREFWKFQKLQKILKFENSRNVKISEILDISQFWKFRKFWKFWKL